MTRIAVIEKERCHPNLCGDYLCMRLCPVNRTGKECIIKGENTKAKINTELCVGCGICPKRCPFEAIHIVNLPESLQKEPIHRYGKNGFHLYSLPTPIFGKVVGVVGVNGIGKSTAIKILAGVLEPNFGKDAKDVKQKDDKIKVDGSKLKGTGADELAKYFKGTEAQLFFEKVRDGKIKVSYKPQQVELIPKTMKGKVRDLLKKVDEKGEMEKISTILELNEIMDTDISSVSGGELQRVAIAATVLKKANLYIFDEPTSYLDIKQRINVSKFIRNLADEDTAVVVIEHDLIVLDYMADLTHIMYGEKRAYGIVSMVKATKTGINIFLEGYMKEENVRFRDSQIKFMSRPPMKKKVKEEFVSWENVKKKLGNFELHAEKGGLKKGDICGVLGENGTGKTTFVKLLAGVIEYDSGSISQKMKVSYKPQYLSSDSDELVSSILKNTMAKYEAQLIGPLELKELFAKKLSELSGGELQRVAIAECLSNEADLYLLDEPSAYLDVEQRLLISKIIKDMISQKSATCLVVDHDLLFADYLSDELIVLEGMPAKKGIVKGPYPMEDGMNKFLQNLKITLRRDQESHRPRINKPESQMDRAQKAEGKLYYS